MQLHMILSQADCDRIKDKEEKSLTEEILKGYLAGFEEELDMEADDYSLQLVKKAYLQGFYQGITSFEKIAIDASFDKDYINEC